jgi:hypothetical protein
MSSQDTVQAYVEYVDVVTRRRAGGSSADHHQRAVGHFGVGLLVGYPRRVTGDLTEALAAAHHLLVSHGLAVPVVRANGGVNRRHQAEIGAVYPWSGERGPRGGKPGRRISQSLVVRPAGRAWVSAGHRRTV